MNSLKNPKWQGSENFCIGDHMEVLGGGIPKEEISSINAISPYFVLCISLPFSCSLVISFIINW